MFFCIVLIIFGVLALIDPIAHLFGTTIVQGWVIQKIENKTVRTILRVIEFLFGVAFIIIAIICFVRDH
jgi:hypothetical protein